MPWRDFIESMVRDSHTTTSMMPCTCFSVYISFAGMLLRMIPDLGVAEGPQLLRDYQIRSFATPGRACGDTNVSCWKPCKVLVKNMCAYIGDSPNPHRCCSTAWLNSFELQIVFLVMHAQGNNQGIVHCP